MNCQSKEAKAAYVQGITENARCCDEAAELQKIANNPNPRQHRFAPIVRGILIGVAEATKIDGAATTGTTPTNVAHVQNTAAASASAAALVGAKEQLQRIIADEELSDDARAELVSAASDLESTDDLRALKRLSTAAAMLSQFPRLVSALDDIIRSVASYL